MLAILFFGAVLIFVVVGFFAAIGGEIQNWKSRKWWRGRGMEPPAYDMSHPLAFFFRIVFIAAGGMALLLMADHLIGPTPVAIIFGLWALEGIITKAVRQGMTPPPTPPAPRPAPAPPTPPAAPTSPAGTPTGFAGIDPTAAARAVLERGLIVASGPARAGWGRWPIIVPGPQDHLNRH